MYTKKDITEYKIDDIYSVFMFLQKRPNIFLSELKLEELIGFINGYLLQFVHQKLKQNPWFEFEQFKHFVSQKYDNLWEQSKADLIKLYVSKANQNSSEAYNLFWNDWYEFTLEKRGEAK